MVFEASLGSLMSIANNRTRLGYDTRSMRSALVMGAVDLLRPFHRDRPFQWAKSCMVSSVAGLGDFFIHLPLIEGIVAQNRREGIETQVALRPSMIEIGELCGWKVLPFDNALVEFFKVPSKMRPAGLLKHFQAARKQAPELWVDLSSNAVNALLIRLSGAQRIAGRVTRGGRSMVDHSLPHRIGECEYSNIHRIAEVIGRTPRFEAFHRLSGPAPGHGAVVLSLTTACRWRNWPLQNFLEIIRAFPQQSFALIGIEQEAATEAERVVLAQILAESNIINLLDRLSLLEMIRVIANARAIVTNDTGSAHIANAFHRPGAVIFGPTDAAVWFRAEEHLWPDGTPGAESLKLFHDIRCPWYPCIQWNCKNQQEWCMSLVQSAPVISHLHSLL